jgi:hypothetical protein
VRRERQKRNEYRVLVGKPEEWRPIGRHRNSVEYNIKLDLNVIGLKWA